MPVACCCQLETDNSTSPGGQVPVQCMLIGAVGGLSQHALRVVAGILGRSVYPDATPRVTTRTQQVVPMTLLSQFPADCDQPLDRGIDERLLVQFGHAFPFGESSGNPVMGIVRAGEGEPSRHAWRSSGTAVLCLSRIRALVSNSSSSPWVTRWRIRRRHGRPARVLRLAGARGARCVR